MYITYINIIITTIFTTSIFIFFSKKFNFNDIPKRSFSLHTAPVPFVGGVSIVFSFLFGMNFFNYPIEIQNILFFGLFFCLLGFIDDKYNLSPIYRLFTASILILLFLNKTGYLKTLGEYEYIGNVGLGIFGFIFTFFAIHLLINAFNYIDGVDGVAITLFLNAIFILLLISPFHHNIEKSLIIFFIILTVILCFNLSFFNLRKIFIGNNGSYFIGFLISALMILFNKQLNVHPALIIWCCSVIVYDFLEINISRILKKKNLFEADDNHIHQLLFKKTNSKILVILMLNLTNLLLALFAIKVIYPIGKIFSLIMFVFCFILFFIIKKMILNKLNCIKTTQNF
jgi:UDP-GlcNAc:undecaprenyl-phosphate GlcNAc-1-phosphate transferase